MPKVYQINAPSWDEVINRKFLDLPYCKDRHMILWGSRGSSKSYAAGEILLDRCVTWKDFRCVCIRKEVSKNADSTFKLLIELIKANGYEELFTWTNSPNMRIRCVNGNEFLFRGMDNIDNIKSLVNISNIWFEEEVPDSENDFETVALTARSNTAPFVQFIYTMNPTITDHTNHWFWKRWFENEVQLTFRKELRMQLDTGEIISEWATIHHSTYLDNKWLDKGTYNALQLLKLKDPYTYATQALGRWSAKMPKGRFWKLFDLAKNSCQHNEYNPDIPIHLSFDFNKNPGMHVGIYQVENGMVKQIDELALANPNNRTEDACKIILKTYGDHQSGVYIYGDPNGYKEDSSTEKGYNNYLIIFQLLAKFMPNNRTMRKAPPVMKSAEWINEIFFSQLDGINILIPEDCKESIADFLYTQEDPEGGVLKNKIKDKEENTSYEKYGHFSDLFRYFMTQCFASEWDRYKTGGKGFKPVILPRINKYL